MELLLALHALQVVALCTGKHFPYQIAQVGLLHSLSGNWFNMYDFQVVESEE